MKHAFSMGRIAAMVFTLCLLALPAAAQSLDQAKAAGEIGERVDGYVGAVAASPSGDIRALVDEVNAGRQAKYAEIAKERGTPVAAVAQIAGQKLIERTAKGGYVMGVDGQWRQK
jgi:uncharacterized protein YdbL (DUF1318 family)